MSQPRRPAWSARRAAGRTARAPGRRSMPIAAQYSANSSPGVRPAWLIARSAPGCSSAANSGSIRISRALGSASLSSSRSPALVRFPDVDPQVVVAELVGAGDEFRDRAVDGAQSAAGGDRDVGDLRRRGRGDLDQADDVGVVLLAEVDRERCAAVEHGARAPGVLPAVQVAERDVVRVGRETPRPARGTRRSTGRPVRRRRTLPPVQVRWAITRLTASAGEPAVRLARMSRTIWS